MGLDLLLYVSCCFINCCGLLCYLLQGGLWFSVSGLSVLLDVVVVVNSVVFVISLSIVWVCWVGCAW